MAAAAFGLALLPAAPLQAAAVAPAPVAAAATPIPMPVGEPPFKPSVTPSPKPFPQIDAIDEIVPVAVGSPLTIKVFGFGTCAITISGIPTPITITGSLPVTVQTAPLPAGKYGITAQPAAGTHGCTGTATAVGFVGPMYVAQPSGLTETTSLAECMAHIPNPANQHGFVPAATCASALAAKQLVLIWSFSPETCLAAPKCFTVNPQFYPMLSKTGINGSYDQIGAFTFSDGFLMSLLPRAQYVGTCFEVAAVAGGPGATNENETGAPSAPYCVGPTPP